MIETPYLSLSELDSGLDTIKQAPKSNGTLSMIVRRPQVDQREVLEAGELTHTEGLVGDTWKIRGSKRTPDGSAHPDMQLTLINTRLITLIAQQKERWPMAGDQLVVDFDLSVENLPPGARLSIGSAVIEISAQPHTGCDKFASRFGLDTLKWVNSPTGKQLRLRGLNAKVVEPGSIKVGDAVKKL